MKHLPERGRAVVVGLGFMGGSIAARLIRTRPGWTIVGVDTSSDACDRAMHHGLVTEAVSDVRTAVPAADLIVLAAPVNSILECLELLPDLVDGDVFVIDIGSTKCEAVAAMERLPARVRAVGGHPMTGPGTAGTDQPSPSVYEGRTFALCWPRSATAETKIEARAFVDELGAVAVELGADEHDRAVAAISHLPYAMGLPLLDVLDRSGDDARRLLAGGFRGRVQGAGRNAPMWADIFSTNRGPIVEALRAYRDEIVRLEERIAAGSVAELRAYLVEAQRRAENLQP